MRVYIENSSNGQQIQNKNNHEVVSLSGVK